MGWLRREWPAIAGLVLLPVIVAAPFLLGMLKGDPALYYGALGVGARSGMLPLGAPFFDPPIGIIVQAQGMLAAKDWLAGTVPWWDPFTGIGVPLAAEMQTLAFFLPFVLLLRFWQGWLILRIVLQAMSGLALYALCRDLGLRRSASFVAGAFYGLCGAFFMMPQTTGPLPFIPLLLLGVERAARAAEAERPLGWGVIAVSLSAMQYGGFPETAFCGGLLAACWTLARGFALPDWRCRRRFTGKIVIGLILGFAMAAPLLVPFAHYVGRSYFGPHNGMFALIPLPEAGRALSVFPFLFGPPALSPERLLAGRAAVAQLSAGWLELGCWFGLAPIAGALCAGADRARRGLVLALLAFVSVVAMRMAGIGPVRHVLNLIPLVHFVNIVRFAAPAMDLALLILMAIAIDRWQRGARLGMPARAAVFVFMAALAACVLVPVSPVLAAWFRTAPPSVVWFGIVGSASGVLTACLVLWAVGRASSRRTVRAVSATMVTYATLGFLGTQLPASRTGHLALGGVHWLQRHQKLSRMFTVFPFGPNYPAAFGVASVNANDLPIAADWNDYVERRLRLTPGLTLAQIAHTVSHHLAAYEAVGVRYVVSLSSGDPFRPVVRLAMVPGRSHALPLGNGISLSVRLRHFPRDLRKLQAVAVQVGTYDGTATGTLRARVCSEDQCAIGHAALVGARDNGDLTIPLTPVLALPKGAPVTVEFVHHGSRPVALWMYPRADGATRPRIAFEGKPRSPAPMKAYHGPVMTIWQLPDPAPFYQAHGCTVAGQSWTRAVAVCTANTTLLRREAWFGGWHATVNHHPVAVHRDGLFQRIDLPKGRDRVAFFYRPRGTHAAVALALLALMLAGVLQWRFRRHGGAGTVARL